MNTIKLSAVASACAALVLVACGGGGGGGDSSDSSTSAPASAPANAPVVSGKSTVSGTVTGFGSVIVDGVRIDNHAVGAVKDMDDGSLQSVELKLGQHVEIEHDGNLVASKVRVVAEVEGAVIAVSPASASLMVLGQTLMINSDATLGPVTVFGAPYTRLADIKLNDVVEIHGIINTDTAGNVTIQATRVTPKVADGSDRVNGLVSELSTTSKTFKLSGQLIDFSGATLLPSGVILANGTEVHVAVPVGTATPGTPVKAVIVRVKDRKAESEGKDAEVGGAISALDPVAKTFTLNGIKVDFSGAGFTQNGRGLSDLKAGTYVVIKGTYGTGGSFKATTIVIRGVDSDRGKDVELHGTILNFVSVANFRVRDVPINATGAVIDTSCGANAQLANNLQVSLQGSLSPSGQVTVSSISCETAQDGRTVIERDGTGGKVDTSAKTFTLTTSKDIITVQWTAATTFVGVDPAALAGSRVEVEGPVAAGVLTAEKIKAESGK